MQKKGKRVVASLIAVLVGAALVAVGVWVWMDGNTGFGAAAHCLPEEAGDPPMASS